MYEINNCLLCALQGVYMYFKEDYISCILTSKQVDKHRSDFQLYLVETPVFLVNSVAVLICHGWSLISQGLAARASSNVMHQLIQEVNSGFTAIKAQCMLRKKALQAEDIYNN